MENLATPDPLWQPAECKYYNTAKFKEQFESVHEQNAFPQIRPVAFDRRSFAFSLSISSSSRSHRKGGVSLEWMMQRCALCTGGKIEWKLGFQCHTNDFSPEVCVLLEAKKHQSSS